MRVHLRSISWRIASAYVILLVLALTGLALIFVQQVYVTYLQTLEMGIAGQARLVALLDANSPADRTAAERAAQVRVIHEQIGARVTLIADDGSVLADSLQSDGATTNLRDRPEVRDALALGQGESRRFSVATGEDAFFVAVPVASAAAPTHIVRLGVPLALIAQAQWNIACVVALTALATTLVAIGLAILIARQTTRPLVALRNLADRFAAGELDVQLPIPNDSDVAALTQALNVMASRLRQLIYTLQNERQRLATILATMADGVMLLDDNQQVTLMNAAATRLLPLPAALPIALTALPVGPSLFHALERVRMLPADGSPEGIERIDLPLSGRSLRAVVTPVAGPTAQALVVLQDLTDLRRAEQARRMLLANISHDLRTPLASLQAMIETLQDGALDDPPAAQDFLARMDDEVQGLTRLITEFLELARIESGQLMLHRVPSNLHALLLAVAGRMQAQAEQRGVALTVDAPPELPTLTLDADRIEQVLLNLLQNALVWTDAGGSVTLGARVGDSFALVWVRDTGVGIAAADLPHIFERFYKVDQARSGGGTGLGLAIALHLVELHGGQITAESQPGQGTTITVALPLAR